MNNRNKGFVSMSALYAFLIVFLLLMVSIASSYVSKNNLVNAIVEQAKEDLVK
ncbi:MAG: hypothetical protein RR228_00730 [Bacilli bacterium]